MIKSDIKKRLDEAFSGLTLDEDTHTYCLNGINLPSVSEIIRPLSDRIYGNIDMNILQKAAQKGTDVHFDIQQYLETGWMPDPGSERYGYFLGFLEWWEKNQYSVIETEQKMYHKSFLYAGTTDLIAFDEREQLHLIDFKTTVDAHPKLWSVQLTAYEKQLEQIVPGYTHRIKTHVIQLFRDGYHKDVPLSDESNTFMACMIIHNFKED